ncbi:hypothetical protein EG329_008418 [Mollisiaceae sp. DMI_Dod_QoI]|nr:hypothetical protein EG329_008418 [Helotiales sp. DMI_Dod_QoI]
MEYLELGDLEGYLKTPLSNLESRQIVQQLLEGIGLMHDNNFVHRDLKPANVLVLRKGPQWWVKIADFGITKRLDDTAARTIIGTEAYLAPEVRGIYTIDSLEADESTFSFAVDIWTIGAITFRMVTGSGPFTSGRKLYDYVVREQQFPIDPRMSPECADFVTKTMAASPRRRPTSWEASMPNESNLIDETRTNVDLDNTKAASSASVASAQWSTSAPTAEQSALREPKNIPLRQKRPPIREPTRVSSHSSTANTTSPLASAQWSTSRVTAEHAKNLQQQTVEIATSLARNEALTEKPKESPSSHSVSVKELRRFELFKEFHFRWCVETVAFSPDGRWFALGCAGNSMVRIFADKQEKLEYLQEVKTKDICSNCSIAFSPDSRLLAFFYREGEVRILAYKQNEFKQVHKVQVKNVDSVFSIAFSPIGQLLVFGSKDGSPGIWADSASKFKQVQKLETDGICSIAYSPNGLLLASGSKDGKLQIWVYNEQGQYEQGQELAAGARDPEIAFSHDGQWFASGNSKGNLRIWAYKQDKFEHFQDIDASSFRVKTIAFSTHGRRFACSTDLGVHIYALED